jgi:hypothetical protein
MNEKRHHGERKKRPLPGSRKPDLGYYVIVTDAKETEKQYFIGLRDSLPKDLAHRLVIKVLPTTEVDSLVDKCIEIVNTDPQYRIPWIVLDRDEVKHFNTIIKKAESAHISVGWSNPCFEVWLYNYFKQPPVMQNSVQCCKQFSLVFKRYVGHQYHKSDTSLYQKLIGSGDEQQAIQRAREYFMHMHQRYPQTLPAEMSPATTVYRLVAEIRLKCPNQ